MPTEETGKSFCLLLGIYHFGAEPALLSPPDLPIRQFSTNYLQTGKEVTANSG